MISLIESRLAKYKPQTVNLKLPEAAVLIAITNEKVPKVVLTKRAQQLSSHSGEIAFPGGKRDDSDRDLIHTALREACEEIALNPDSVRVISTLDETVSLHNLKVTPCVGIIPADTELQANLAELDCVFKVPLQFFLDQSNRCDHLDAYQSKGRFAPCYIFDGHLIWGLTCYMLIQFLNVTLDAEIKLHKRLPTLRV